MEFKDFERESDVHYQLEQKRLIKFNKSQDLKYSLCNNNNIVMI